MVPARSKAAAAALGCAGAALLLAVVSWAPSASAHLGGVESRARILKDPGLAGVEVRVAASVSPVLVVTNRSGGPLVVEGEEGEPFLRIAGGSVEVNRNSPTAYRSLDALGDRPLPQGLRPQGPVGWERVAEGVAWTWFDPRLRLREDRRQQAWEIRMTTRGRVASVRGITEPMEDHGHLVAVIERVAPGPPGLEVRVLDGPVPALFVRNDTAATLEVPGLTDEAFLRIGPDGVWANKRSPTWYLAGSQATGEVPDGADAGADPVFEQVSQQPLWTWLEYRARLPDPEDAYVLGVEPKTVMRWTTPAVLDGAPVEIQGSIRWTPAVGAEDTGGGRGWVPVALAGSGVLVLALVLGRRLAGNRQDGPVRP